MDYKFTGYNRTLKDRAVELRKNMTSQERRLWYTYLKKYPIHFYRQRVIDKYIADFYCSKAKLVIEIDGLQHFTDSALQYDEYRTFLLGQYGLEVIRFTNTEIDHDFQNVCEAIDKKSARKNFK